jgi:hypothetical protein
MPDQIIKPTLPPDTSNPCGRAMYENEILRNYILQLERAINLSVTGAVKHRPDWLPYFGGQA